MKIHMRCLLRLGTTAQHFCPVFPILNYLVFMLSPNTAEDPTCHKGLEDGVWMVREAQYRLLNDVYSENHFSQFIKEVSSWQSTILFLQAYIWLTKIDHFEQQLLPSNGIWEFVMTSRCRSRCSFQKISTLWIPQEEGIHMNSPLEHDKHDSK